MPCVSHMGMTLVNLCDCDCIIDYIKLCADTIVPSSEIKCFPKHVACGRGWHLPILPYGHIIKNTIIILKLPLVHLAKQGLIKLDPSGLESLRPTHTLRSTFHTFHETGGLELGQ